MIIGIVEIGLSLTLMLELKEITWPCDNLNKTFQMQGTTYTNKYTLKYNLKYLCFKNTMCLKRPFTLYLKLCLEK